MTDGLFDQAPKVYLAGPITGLTFEGCTSWREYAKQRLRDYGLEGWSPMRAKDYLLEAGVLSGHPDAYNEYVLSSAKGILYRDHWDCQTADLIFCNFLGADKISVGTVMEIAFGYAYRKPVIVVMEEDNVHHHAMLDTAAGWVCDDLEYGIALAAAILKPDGVKVPR